MKKSLKLKKETLRRLDAASFEKVNGGIPPELTVIVTTWITDITTAANE